MTQFRENIDKCILNKDDPALPNELRVDIGSSVVEVNLDLADDEVMIGALKRSDGTTRLLLECDDAKNLYVLAPPVKRVPHSYIKVALNGVKTDLNATTLEVKKFMVQSLETNTVPALFGGDEITDPSPTIGTVLQPGDTIIVDGNPGEYFDLEEHKVWGIGANVELTITYWV